MDAWVPYAVRERCRDMARTWAELEGKSPLMTEQLLRNSAEQASKPIGTTFVIAAGMRLITWGLDTWWHLTR